MAKNGKEEEVVKKSGLVLGKKQLIAVIIVIFIVAGLVLFKTVLKDKLFPTPSAVNSEVAAVVAKVGRLMILPNEDVTLAVVSDVSKLSSQPFFSHAANGDQVLIYTASKKAILYRPSINKIIEVGPITLNQSPQPTGVQTSSASSSVKAPVAGSLQVMILNGTTVAGLASTTKKTLADKFPDFTFFMGDASNKYSRTKVVDLTGNNRITAEKVATAIDGDVVQLPPGETKPNTDILVIIGK